MRRAITFVELLVVLALLAIIATASMPRLRAMAQPKVSETKDKRLVAMNWQAPTFKELKPCEKSPTVKKELEKQSKARKKQ